MSNVAKLSRKKRHGTCPLDLAMKTQYSDRGYVSNWLCYGCPDVWANTSIDATVKVFCRCD